jgi:DNA (cytosine-5)-methyltransferase 1
VCSGIEAATVAWHPLGWTPVAFSEVEAFPSAVLQHYHPSVPNLGDMTRFKEWPDATVDVLVGGTPCQSFSVAGLRKGLDDPRGNLALVYLALADRYRPKWVVWENVPGVLSADKGRAFGSFLGGLAGLGYGFAYRVLDAQYFGLAQRRKRVFVVGHLGDWRRAAAVLFERESLSGHPAPRRETRQDVTPLLEVGARTGVSTNDPRAGIGIGGADDPMFTLQAGKQHGIIAPTVPSRSKAGGGLGTDFDCDGGLIASTGNISHCLNAGGMGRIDYETETLIAHELPAVAYGGNNTSGPINVATAVLAKGGTGRHSFDSETFIAHALRADGFDASEDSTGRGTPLIVNNTGQGWWNEAETAAPIRDMSAGGGAKESTLVAIPEPYTLAIRGRADGSTLEVRTDGLANAVVTPNGGRGGINVGAVAFQLSGDRADPAVSVSEVAFSLPANPMSDRGQAVAFDTTQITSAANRSNPKPGDPCHPLAAGAHPPAVAFADVADQVAANQARTYTREGTGNFRLSNVALTPAIGLDEEQNAVVDGMGCLKARTEGGGFEGSVMTPSMQVRRLTPRECERLQGFPDDYTRIPYRGKPAADGPRYKALGNSMAVPVMRWIGRRISQVEDVP